MLGKDQACWWADHVQRLQDYGFLASGVCPLVGEAGLEVRADSLEGRARAQGILGLVPAHWWVELSPGPSGGQGHVQSGCGVRGS